MKPSTEMQETVQMCKRPIFKYSFNHFLFSSKEGAEISFLGGLEIPHDQQQSLMVLLSPHQDGDQARSEM